MRRLLAGAGAAGLALVLAAPIAAHADTIPQAWSNSKSTTDTSVGSGTFDITAEFRRARPLVGAFDVTVKTTLTVPSGLPSGCGSGDTIDVPSDPVEEPVNGVFTTRSHAAVTCNGRYQALIDAQMVSRSTRRAIDAGAQLTPTIEVKMRPANVSSANAGYADGKVAISWTPIEDKTPDFVGYQVQIAADDEWKTVDGGELGRNDTFLVVDAPKDPGTAVYRVRARRAGPDGDVYSADPYETRADIPEPGSSTTTPVTNPDGTPNPNGGAGGSGGAGGAGGAGGSGGTAGSGSGGTHKGGGRSFTPLKPGIVGVGTKAPRLGAPVTGNVSGLLNDQDSGYKEELDYGDQELAGGEDSGEDGLSSFYYEGSGGRGMAAPVATGFVLAAWAFHFRYLARAAKPAKKRRPVQPRGGWA